MKRQLSGLLVGGSVAALCLGSAYAITDTNFTYTTEKIGYLNVNAMAFAADGFEPAQSMINSWGEGIMSQTSYAPCFNAGVNLPHGAVVTKVTMWSTSTDNEYPKIWLKRIKLSDNASEDIAALIATDTSETRKSFNVPLVPASATINTVQYWYALAGCVSGNAASVFHGVRITYTYKNAGA